MHRAAFVVDIEHYCISGHKNHQGDVKHVRLTIRGAKRTDIQDAIHYGFVQAGDVDKHGYSNGPDSSSFTVQVEGHVDVGTLCDRLKKKASSVKIEAVIPGDLKAKMARQEQELSSLKKQNEELKDSAGEEKRRLRTELGSAEEEKRKLHRRIKDLESSNSQLEVQIRSRRIDVVTIHEEEVHAKLRISEDSRRRIK
ncbi:hypothetical protein U9M48_012072 [Paspalum notatum var. saurae]|uniref:Uncharacterized protein n=1 Tax=Paspalum notatum var. saurae TaxID=547442 RepID=A0AAQ3SWR9_PASNO